MSYGDFNTIANKFTQGLRELPTDYVTRVRNFLAEYLGSARHPVPFGGRTKEFAALDSWLTDTQAAPYLLLTAPAGRGKSALLLRWCQQLFARQEIALAYFPVSIRFRTNLAGIAFPSLVALLARLHEEQVPTDPNIPEEVWRGLLSDFMTRPLPNGRTLLLVIDGVDEAADWSAGSGIFPLNPPPGLRVVLSARSLANDQGADAWLQRLGWTSPGLARTLDLSPLDRNGIVSVLNQMGFPLDIVSTHVNIVSELYRLSEGDPLLVRLYVDDLWSQGEAVVRLRPEQLRAIRPGLEGYFERWWQDQRLLWSESALEHETLTQTILNLLAAALGPLSQTDILSLLPSGAEVENLERSLAPLARFVTGDGIHQGYVFSHPRLGNYFLEEQLNESERQTVEQRFLDWGAQTLAALNEGHLAPELASSYCIQYYGAHLERAHADAHSLQALISEGWLHAWEKLDRANAGFLGDVERAERAIERENQQAIEAGTPVPYLGEEIRCLLCQVSINSMTSNISPRLMLEAVKTGIWTPAQGLACIRLISDLTPRARELAGLAPFIQEPLRSDILQEALDTIATIKDEYARLDALIELAPALPEVLLWQVLEVLPTIEDEADKAGILAELAPTLSSYPALMEKALDYEQEIIEEEYRALALEGLAASFAATHIEHLWQEIETLQDERYRAQAMTALIPFLEENALQTVRSMTLDMQDGLARIRLLAELLIYLPASSRADALQETLDLLQEIEDREYRVEVLLKLAPFLPEEKLQQTLREIQLVWDESQRADALISLLPSLPKTLFAEFQEVAQEIKNDEHCTRVLRQLFPLVPEELQDQILKRLQRTWDEGCRAELLVQCILTAPKSLLPRLAEIISTIRDQGYRVWLLAELEVPLKGKLNDTSFSIADVFQAMRGREERLQTLLAIVPRLSEEALTKIFQFMLPELFNFSWRIQSDEQRAHILTKLAPRLPENWLPGAITAIRGMSNKLYQVQALVALAPRIQGTLLSEALNIVRGMKERDWRAQVLEALVSSLPKEQRGKRVLEMLQVLQVIEDEADRASMISSYASYLPTKLSLHTAQLVIQALYSMIYTGNKAQIISALATRIPEQFFAQFLSAIQVIPYRWTRIQILDTLIPYASESSFFQIWDAIDVIEHIGAQENLLIKLSAYIPPGLSSQVWPIVQEMETGIIQTHFLKALLPQLVQEKPKEALEIVRTLPEGATRTEIIEALLPHASPGIASALLNLLLPVEPKTLSIEILEQGFRKNKDLLYIFASMVPVLPEEQAVVVASSLLKILAEGKVEEERVAVLSKMALHVPPVLMREMLKAIWSFTASLYREQVLNAFLPSLTDSDWLEVSTWTTKKMQDTGYPQFAIQLLKISATLPLAPPPALLYPILHEITHLLAQHTRRETLTNLASLAPILLTIGDKKAVIEACNADLEVGCWWP
jgi:hypothetical protein